MVPSLLRSGDVTPSQVGAWRALAKRALEPNPFYEPDYILPLSRYAGEHRLLTVRSGADFLAVLPVVRLQVRWAGVPVPIWCVPNPLGSPLLEPEQAEPALELGFDFLSMHSTFRKVLLVTRLPVEGPVADAFGRSSRNRILETAGSPVRCPVLRRRVEDTYLDQTLHGRRRKHVRRQRADLERLLGNSLRLVDRAADPGAVERFLALEASGWKGRAGTALLCTPEAARWFREVCAGFGAAGRLRILSLEAGSTTVAMKCDVAAGGGLFNLKTAYDESFARFSPGVLLEVEAVTAFHREPEFEFMDASSNYPKNPLVWLYPEGRLLANRTLTLGGRATRAVIGGLVSSRNVIRPALRFLARERRPASPSPSP